MKNCYVVEFTDNEPSPLNVDLGVAPERGQPFGARAKQNLARLTFGNPVEIRWHKPDRYGRLVGQVWVDVSAGRAR